MCINLIAEFFLSLTETHERLFLAVDTARTRRFFSAAADRALGMVGQQIFYTVEEKDAMILKNLDNEVK